MKHSLITRAVLFFFFLSLCSGTALSQAFRSVDGRGNNQQHTEWGATNAQLDLKTSLDYGDAISTPNTAGKPNPRTVSNVVSAQNAEVEDEYHLSDYLWVFGQFISHDIVYTPDNPGEPLDIQVPAFDPVFDPDGEGGAFISMFRSAFDPATGLSPENPRRPINAVTAYLDGSAIYGADDFRANWLRTFIDGKLKVSGGNLLPFNTLTGEFNDPSDPTAPFMIDRSGADQKLFVAGDPRANENPLLIAMHTLFVREHNRQCELLKKSNPGFSEEDLYQHAKRIVTAHLQSIFFDEWLPEVGIQLPDYGAYDPGLHPGISNLFSAAAFKLKHTLTNSMIKRMNTEGETLPIGDLALLKGFYEPREILLAGGIDPYMKGMGVQVQQRFDCQIIDELRNHFGGSVESEAIDVAAINIMRGRERGLPGLNAVREAYGLPKFNNFAEICSDQQVAADLETLYGSVDNLDPWIGFLAEGTQAGSIFGRTLIEVLSDQFIALRDGDRYYYENDPLFSEEEIMEIKNTLFSDIIIRNSGLGLMQKNVFKAMQHEDIPFDNIIVVKRRMDMALFPNPVYKLAHFKVYSFHTGTGSFEVMDMSGKKLLENTIDFTEGENTMSFDIGDLLNPGVYLARMTLGRDENTIKFIVH